MTREKLMDIAVDNWPDTVIDLLINILEAPTEEQQRCEYCHCYGSRLDNESVWGSKPIQGIDFYDVMAINLSKRQLVTTNALHAFPINYCPMCGCDLREDE